MGLGTRKTLFLSTITTGAMILVYPYLRLLVVDLGILFMLLMQELLVMFKPQSTLRGRTVSD